MDNGTTKIYESPDGGRTVYSRNIGSLTRDLVESDRKDDRTWDGRPLIEHMKEDQMWGEIRIMARTDSGLQDLLERAIVYYHLRKQEGTNE
jgi:hypothetical protein